MRLVDADEAKKYLYEHLDDLHMIAAQNAIDEMPTIDAQPVKHGKWVDYGSGVGMYCSECRHRIRYRNGIRETTKFSDGEFEFVQYASKNGYYNFCPKCGAKMDGDADA